MKLYFYSKLVSLQGTNLREQSKHFPNTFKVPKSNLSWLSELSSSLLIVTITVKNNIYTIPVYP